MNKIISLHDTKSIKERARSANGIFGLARGYDFQHLEVFLESLQHIGYNEDVVLFVIDPVDPILLGKIETYHFNVILIDISQKQLNRLACFFLYKYFGFCGRLKIDTGMATKPLWRLYLNARTAFIPDFMFNMTYIMLWRFWIYYHTLSLMKYEGVLLTDTRDVYFQDNPFKNMDKSAVSVFAESGKIKDDYWNSLWIEKAFSKEVLDQICDGQIFCAGTILATRIHLLSFLYNVMETVFKHRVPLDAGGNDQAILNYLIHCNSHPFVLKQPGDTVLTAGLFSAEDFEFKGPLIQLSGFDQVPAIVHQYDRHPQLVDFINRIISRNCTGPEFAEA